MSRTRQAIINARLFDSASGQLRPNCTIVIEGERISAVTQEPLQVDDATMRSPSITMVQFGRNWPLALSNRRALTNACRTGLTVSKLERQPRRQTQPAQQEQARWSAAERCPPR